jgi:hypothetical protein
MTAAKNVVARAERNAVLVEHLCPQRLPDLLLSSATGKAGLGVQNLPICASTYGDFKSIADLMKAANVKIE